MRIYPTEAEARESGGLMCPATLPQVGTTVEIEGKGTATVLQSQPAVQSQLYGGLASLDQPAGFDGGCTLQIQYSDGTTDSVSAAAPPRSEVEELVDNVSLVAGLGYCAANLLFLGGDPGASEYEEMLERYEEEMERSEEMMEERSESPSSEPSSAEVGRLGGEFWGGSEESDEGDQAIRVTLRFDPDGRITGRGRDGADGSYQITSGHWEALADGNLRLAWFEEYDEGFGVVCMGEYDATSAKINARFASSRGVSGTFELARKLSIF